MWGCQKADRGRTLTVGRDDDVRDKVVVPLEDLFGETVLVVISGELPDDDALVCHKAQVGLVGVMMINGKGTREVVG
jgi:hypothetical protein